MLEVPNDRGSNRGYTAFGDPGPVRADRLAVGGGIELGEKGREHLGRKPPLVAVRVYEEEPRYPIAEVGGASDGHGATGAVPHQHETLQVRSEEHTSEL